MQDVTMPRTDLAHPRLAEGMWMGGMGLCTPKKCGLRNFLVDKTEGQRKKDYVKGLFYVPKKRPRTVMDF